MSTYTYGNITLTPSNTNAVWTTASTGTAYTLGASTGTWADYSHTNTVNIDNKGITLQKEADLIIGGKSIKTMLEAIESRLAMLNPNPALEQEWEQLKKLGDEYRALEKEIKEKAKTWDILKK